MNTHSPTRTIDTPTRPRLPNRHALHCGRIALQ
jgi:hypothetical protein